ncbi:hypothetical protein CSHISOI_04980, partial [Colletotrichum shisoi]
VASLLFIFVVSAPVSNQVDNVGKSVAVLDASVSPDGQIGSSQFLDAVDSLLLAFGMHIVENDPLVGGRNSCEENVAISKATLIGYFPLHSGIEFYVASVRRIANNASEKLSGSIVDPYKGTLKKHHGFVAKTAIKVAVSKTCPTRDAPLRKLGQDPAMVVSERSASLCDKLRARVARFGPGRR